MERDQEYAASSEVADNDAGSRSATSDARGDATGSDCHAVPERPTVD
jgi:hypothetical protein